MPIARCSLRCGSPNAFRPQAALWNLFLEQQQPLNLPNARCLSLSHRSLQDAQSTVETPPNGGPRPSKPPSIPPSEYINTASLRGTLQALREKNRDNFLSQDNPPSDKASSGGSGTTGNELDILFEERRFDINKFSFPQHKNFEGPSSDQSQTEVSNTTEPTHNRPSDHAPGPKRTKADKVKIQKMSHTAVELLEYEGMYVRPSMGEAKLDQEYPWTENIPGDVHGKQRLDAELLGFLEYIKPTPAEEAATKAVTQSIRDTVKKLSPHQDTEVFGSQASGLVLATSDIDIRLYDPENKDLEQAPRHQSRKEMVAHLLKFSKRLNLDNKEYMMVRMRHARYPLISTVHKKSGLDVQIVAGNDTSNSQQIIKQYMSEYPYLYAHFAFIKSMLDIRGLTDVYRGGLGSYSLFMMIAAALKTKVLSQTEGKHPGQSLAGKRLNGVLQFYAELDTYKSALMLKPPYSVAKHTVDSNLSAEHEAQLAEAPYLQGLHELALVDPMQPYLLCLQDPADPLNDLGRKGYGWKHIQATFKNVRGSINQQMANSNREGWKGSIIAKAVGPCFEAYKARRAITEAYGQEILETERAKKEAEAKAAEKKAVEAETADI